MWYVNYILIKLNLSPQADWTPPMFRQLCRSDLRLTGNGALTHAQHLLCTICFVQGCNYREDFQDAESEDFVKFYSNPRPVYVPYTQRLCNHYDIPVRHI